MAYLEFCKKALNATCASDFLSAISQLQFYSVRFSELKAIFPHDFIVEGLGATDLRHKIENPAAHKRIEDRLRHMWRARILQLAQEEINKETVVSMKRRLRNAGIDLESSERGKSVVKTMWHFAYEKPGV